MIALEVSSSGRATCAVVAPRAGERFRVSVVMISRASDWTLMDDSPN
jgi:hypothetical protein